MTEIRRMFWVSAFCVVLADLVMILFEIPQGQEPLIMFILWLSAVPVLWFSRWFIRIVAAKIVLWGEPVALLARDVAQQHLVGYFSRQARLDIIPGWLSAMHAWGWG